MRVERWGKVMPNGSGEGGATEALADHLGSLIDNLANFRTKSICPGAKGYWALCNRRNRKPQRKEYEYR